ncbi:MAG: hypothetical protein ACU84J_09930 [Gammaproteobacteria bacterium]
MLRFKSYTLKPGAIALILLMAATRSHHFGTPFALPDASLAVFFLGGLWFGGWLLFAGLLAEAGLIDYLAITQFNVSDFCISPAYIFLLPAYAAMWFGGTFCARFVMPLWRELCLLSAAVFVSASTAFLISSGSFYWLSGRYSALSWSNFFERSTEFYPPYLSSAFVYAVLIIAAVKLVKLLPAFNSEHHAA